MDCVILCGHALQADYRTLDWLSGNQYDQADKVIAHMFKRAKQSPVVTL